MPLPDFRPPPLLGNPHVQTVLGTFVAGRGCPRPQKRYVVRLPDGDALLLHENISRRWLPGRPVVLLVHGLSGWHRSPHIRRLAGRMLAEGWRTFRIDLRGAGDGVSLARGTYHAGRSADLRAVLEFIHRLCPTCPMWLAAISLGGNMALKLAGESADDPVPGLSAVVALNPPIDMVACADMIALPRNRIYERRFVTALAENARLRGLHFPDRAPPDWDMRRLTIREFDDTYTAPRNGFLDAADYYASVSSECLIPRIKLPTLILTAADDPFIGVQAFQRVKCPPGVDLVIQALGGHIGYFGPDGAGGVRWAERYVVEWLKAGAAHLAR
jgi:predicted alpha/beta-fold hydrolase